MNPELLEALMIFSFSISWYWSIAKMLRTGQAAGKSVGFVILICVGYAFGIGSKLVHWDANGELSPLIWLYVWNLCVTTFDLFLVLWLTRRGEIRAKVQSAEAPFFMRTTASWRARRRRPAGA